MGLNLSDIEHLFATKGGEQYTGEPVTQLEHALQSAMLSCVTGCWLESAPLGSLL